MTRKGRLRRLARKEARKDQRGGRPTLPLAPPTQKPLPSLDLLDGAHYVWGDDRDDDHALKRLQERGIGVYEVLAALAQPDWTMPASKHHPNRTMYFRGDLGVVLEANGRTIVTVVDRLNGTRTSPRVALAPSIVPTADKPDSPEITFLPERQPLMPTTSESGANKDANNGTSQAIDWSSVEKTPMAVARWVLAHKPGDEFSISELSDAFAGNSHFTDSALRQQVVAWANDGHLTRKVRGIYEVTKKSHAHARNLLEPPKDSLPAHEAPAQGMTIGELDQAAEELDVGQAPPEPVVAEPVEPVKPPVVEPIEPEPIVYRSAKSTMEMTLTAVWSPPPARVSGLGAITDAVRDHVLDAVLAKLKERPGDWMQILVIKGGANSVDLAGKRIQTFRKDNPYEQLEMVARTIEEGKSAGVWARWVDKPATSKTRKESARAA